MKLSEIILALSPQTPASWHGADKEIDSIAPLEEAEQGTLTFLSNPKLKAALQTTQAEAVIVSPDFLEEALALGLSCIVTQEPYLYFAKVAALLRPVVKKTAGVHASAVIGHETVLGAGTHIGALAVVGDSVRMGRDCVIHAHAVIGDGVVLGDEVVVYPNVTIYEGCHIGNRVILHSGCVIGADGFGLAWDKDHWFKIPQTGAVVLGDDVEIGANTTVDRGTLRDTVIENDVKIDNLVQVAHNVHIGAHTAIAGCTGIAGSAHIGKNCILGGAVMMVGHINIADKTHIGGGTLVSKSIKKAGHYASSFPLSSAKDWVKNAAHLRRLDDWVHRIQALEKASVAQDRAEKNTEHHSE